MEERLGIISSLLERLEMGATDIIHSAADLMHLRGLRMYTTITTWKASKVYNMYSDLKKSARRQKKILKDEYTNFKNFISTINSASYGNNKM